jgi:hypothetical protein
METRLLRQLATACNGTTAQSARFPGSSDLSRDYVMKKLLLVAAVLTANVPFAFAQHSGTPQEQNACSRDASRLCRKDLGNDGAVQGCLQQNRARLSASCRKVFESHGM